MVPQPAIQNGDDGVPINLVLRLDQGTPYRVGMVEFLGLNEKTQNQLAPPLNPATSSTGISQMKYSNEASHCFSQMYLGRMSPFIETLRKVPSISVSIFGLAQD
jgi:hypothetical protein